MQAEEAVDPSVDRSVHHAVPEDQTHNAHVGGGRGGRWVGGGVGVWVVEGWMGGWGVMEGWRGGGGVVEG